MEQQGSSLMAVLIMVAPILIIWYLLVIGPQQKERKKHDEMVKSLAKNDEVVTTGGIHGTVVNVKETSVVLRVDDNAKMEVDKYAIAYTAKKRSGEEK